MVNERFDKRLSFPAWVVLALALILVGTATTAVSQEVTSDIYGKVSDDQGLAIPGAAVTLTSPQMMGTESRTTSESGTYRVTNLPAGTYMVVAELPGFQTVTVEQVVLRAGQSIAVNVTLSPAGVEETITVTGESPLVDVKNVQAMRTLDTEILENIPMGRRYADLIVTAPGVHDSEYGFTPAQTVHGSTPRDNLFNVDGASTNDTTVGYISTEIPIDMIDEVQITTGGINAEFGLATGGVFNFVTKSGGNEYHGTANFFYQGEQTSWDNLTPELAEVIPTGSEQVKNQEIGGTLGGRIIMDKLWFFGNLRRTNVSIQEPFLPATTTDTNQTHGFIKLTSQMGANTRINGSLTTRDQAQDPGNVRSFSNADSPETWNILNRRQRILNIAATHVISESTLFDARFNRTWKHFTNEYPNNPDFTVGYTDLETGTSFGGLTGSGVSETFKRDMGQFHLSLTHFKENWGGSHEFKTGFYAERSPFDDRDWFPNGEDVEQRLRNGEADRVRLRMLPSHQKTSMNRYAFFFQDQWTVGENVTLNLGVRWEGTEGWYPEQQAGGGRFFPEATLPEQHDVINFSTWSPRLGIVWAFDEGRTSIKASYGRYYGALLNQHLLITTTIGGYEEYEWNDRNGDLVFQEGETGTLTGRSGMPAVAAGAPLRSADPDLRPQYIDNVQVGFERQVGRDLVFSVSAIYKRERDIIEDMDIGRPFSAYNQVPATNPIDGETIRIFTLDPSYLGSASVPFLTNPDDPFELYRDYKAVELVAQKRFADNWQFMASYTWSEAFGNIGNSYGSSWGGLRLYNDPNYFINAEGPLDLDVPHAFKLGATYIAPGDIWLSGYYLGMSGYPLKLPSDFPSDPALGSYTVRFFDDEVPEIVVEDFVTVAGVQRGTFRHDFRHMLSLRAEKKFVIRGDMRIGLIGDIFNVFNSSRVTTVQSLRTDLPEFLLPARIEFPRILRIGIRFEF